MKTLARLAARASSAPADVAPESVLADALGLAALCLMIGLGFAATALT